MGLFVGHGIPPVGCSDWTWSSEERRGLIAIHEPNGICQDAVGHAGLAGVFVTAFAIAAL